MFLLHLALELAHGRQSIGPECAGAGVLVAGPFARPPTPHTSNGNFGIINSYRPTVKYNETIYWANILAATAAAATLPPPIPQPRQGLRRACGQRRERAQSTCSAHTTSDRASRRRRLAATSADNASNGRPIGSAGSASVSASAANERINSKAMMRACGNNNAALPT